MRKTNIQVIYYSNTVLLEFINLEKAEAAYEALKQALQGYKRFKNDSADTIEVDAEDGKSLFRLEHMDAVLFNSGENWEEGFRERLLEEKKARELRDELGLPPFEGVRR